MKVRSIFKKGDQVEHLYRGKGVFEEYGLFTDESVVSFDEDSDGNSETLTVSTVLLKKIDDK